MATVLVATALLGGCASSREAATARYSEVDDEMTYRARDLSLGRMFPTGGLSRDPSVVLRSWARCSGQDCQPQEVWFSFVVRGSSESRVLSDRDVEIQADGTLHEWPENRQRMAEAGVRTSGSSMDLPGNATNELTRISMDLSTFREIAQAQNVSGQLGSEDFSLSYDDRAPLRAMLDEVTPGSSVAPASESR